MGYRTVVVLYNDEAHLWEKDPELGERISQAMNKATIDNGVDIGYGNVFQCVHADTMTLAMFDGYYGRALATSFWTQTDHEARALELVQQAADKLGYRLVKKSKSS